MREVFIAQLAAAASEKSVVVVAGRYLAEWAPHELAAIPAGARPGAVRDVEELADTAFALTKARIDCTSDAPLLGEMEAFFARACARVSELDAVPQRLPGKSYLTR